MPRVRNLHLLNDANGVPKRRRTQPASASSAAVTVDSDSDDVSRDQDYTPSSRSRARPRRLSYSGSQSPRPITPSFSSNDDGGMVVEREAGAEAPVADEVKLTTTSSEARLQVQTFAAYIDRIANENSQSQTRVTDLESQVDASRDEIRNCNAIIDTQRTELTDAQRSMDNLRAENAGLQGRLSDFQAREDDAKDIFYDDVAYGTARCPLPLTSGKYMGIETVMRYWLKSSYFDGKATSMFQCPLSRQLVRIQDMSVVKMVYDLASRIGIDVTAPLFFQYDINIAPSGEQTDEYHPRWETYGIESQLHLMAALIALYRDRRFGAGRRTVQVNDTHTVSMVRTGSNSGFHDVTFSLSVVWNGGAHEHMISLAEREGADMLFDDFNLHAIVVPDVGGA